MWKFSSALRQKSHLHYATEEERQHMQNRFLKEGLDEFMPDEKKLPHVWRWLMDTEINCLSLRKQIEKLHRQQEADLKEVEEYIENVWKISNERLVQLENENRSLKQDLVLCKKMKDCNLHASNELMGKRCRNLNGLNEDAETSMITEKQPIKEESKPDKKSPFSNVKQMFSNSKNEKELAAANQMKKQEQKQVNLEKELHFLIEKCRQTELDKKQLESENENLAFKLSEALAICDQLESGVADQAKLAKSSKSLYELRQTSSDYRLNRLHSNKSIEGATSLSKRTSVDHSQVNVNADSGIESCSTLADSRESCQDAKSALKLMDAVRAECAILKKELILKEKQYADLQQRYNKRKAQQKERLLRLKDHIERESKRWERLFSVANQKRLQAENELIAIKQS